jgi:N-methylhydantoinase B
VATPRGGLIDNYGYGDGMLNPPFGLFGGTAGDGGALYRINRDGTRSVFNAFSYFRVSEGETWCGISSGGGGYGNPLEREPEVVAADVADGVVSREVARDVYGVILRDGGAEVDDVATAEQRRRLSGGANDAVWTPTTPDAATYYREIMTAGDTFEIDAQPPPDVDTTLEEAAKER